MIPILPQPEPVEFDEQIRQRGSKFLLQSPTPPSKEWQSHAYWTNATSALFERYDGICAYSCLRIYRDANDPTVDHYRPKSKHPNLAYEWSNFRLCTWRMNRRKGDYEDVLDPFTLGKEWLVLDFPSMLVKPNTNVPPDLQKRVTRTIARLKLNQEPDVKARFNRLQDYCNNYYTFAYLQTEAPFVASELERQDLIKRIVEILK